MWGFIAVKCKHYSSSILFWLVEFVALEFKSEREDRSDGIDFTTSLFVLFTSSTTRRTALLSTAGVQSKHRMEARNIFWQFFFEKHWYYQLVFIDRKKFAKYLRNICETFAKYSRSEKHAKNSRKIMPQILWHDSHRSYINWSLSLETNESSPLWWETSVSLDDCVYWVYNKSSKLRNCLFDWFSIS